MGDASQPSPREDALDPATKRRGYIIGIVFVLLLGTLIGFVIWGTDPDGEARGAVSVPGELAIDLKSGDVLHFTTDADVVFPDTSSKGTIPEGCQLELTLELDGKSLTANCDFFRNDGKYAIRSTHYTRLGGGLKRLQLEGARTVCAFRAPGTGRAILRAKSNLDTCVRSMTSARANIYVEADS